MSRYIVCLGIIVLAAAMPASAGATHKPGHGGGGGAQPSLTLGANPNPVVFGRTTLLSGRLRGPNNAGRTIVLEGDRYPFDAYRSVASANTDTKGDYSFTRRPRAHTRYRVRQGSLFSPVATVLVRIRVSLRLSDSTPRRGRLVRFSGRACPTHDGALVRIQRKSSTGRYVTVRRTRLREAERCSVYSRRLRVYRDGRFRTVVSADANHSRGISRSRVIDVH